MSNHAGARFPEKAELAFLVLATKGLMCHSFSVQIPKLIPFDPVTLKCPRCGAGPGVACDRLKGEFELIHIERIEAAALADKKASKARKK